MPRPVSRTPAPELALPVAALAALRQALADDVGPDAAAHALRRAGHAAGDALLAILAAGDGSEPNSLAELSEAEFWRRLSDHFAARGWGRLSHQAVHSGVGMLESPDWVEANPDFAAERPSCFFTTGMLANILAGVATRPVAMLEVECRSRGDLHCRYLFGAPETLRVVYDAAAAGPSELDTILAGLA